MHRPTFRFTIFLLSIYLTGCATAGGVIAGDRYTSPRGWFSVQVPKSSNLHGVRFTIKDDTQNSHDANYDVVTFSAKDFGESFIVGVDYFPDDVIAKNRMREEGHRTVLSKLSNMALGIARQGQGYPSKPKVIKEEYLSTPYGEALFRLYLAEKGSTIVEIKSGGGMPPVAKALDALIAIVVTMQKNNFIYAISESADDGASIDSSKDESKKRIQSFFATITVPQ